MTGEVVGWDGSNYRLRLRFVARADLPDTEDLWAEPVDAHDGGGTYRLLNTSFVVPLGAGDTVRAAIDGRGRLQIVDIVRPCDRVLTVTGHEDSVSTEDAQEVAQGWTEGTDGSTRATTTSSTRSGRGNAGRQDRRRAPALDRRTGQMAPVRHGPARRPGPSAAGRDPLRARHRRAARLRDRVLGPRTTRRGPIVA